jgi:peptide methionine sulfoxide reductase MsrA
MAAASSSRFLLLSLVGTTSSLSMNISPQRLHIRQQQQQQQQQQPPLQPQPQHYSMTARRGFLGSSASASAAAAAALFLGSCGEAARAADGGGEELVDVYFGCGCFWHVQHEFVAAEKKIIGRSDDELTAYAGYAGGLAKDDKVCYHNMMGVQDYGKLGHAEVVGMKVPPSQFGAIAEEYFKLFSPEGVRPDQFGDRGSEYRNLVGFPGGPANKDLYEKLLQASLKTGDRVDFGKGKGDDADAKALVRILALSSLQPASQPASQSASRLVGMLTR